MAAEALPAWEAHCRSRGLLVTTPRRAIISALLQASQPLDAVAVLLAARQRHPMTSLGTVYRLLRELEQRGLLQVHAQAHGRLRWQLRDASPPERPVAAGNISALLQQTRGFLRELDRLGIAEARTTADRYPANLAEPPSPVQPSTSIGQLLCDVAAHLGYRLA